MKQGQVARYGLLGLPLAFGALPIYLYVPEFYARTGLLGLATIGVVLLLTRFLDAVADPCFGWLIDRHPRKSVLYISFLPFILGFFALFTPPIGDVDPVLWLSVALICCTLGFSAVMIAYQAWGGDMGFDTAERLRLTGAREAFMLGGVVIAAVIPTAVADDPLVGMTWLPIFLIGFVFVVILAIYRLPAGCQRRSEKPLAVGLGVVWADRCYRQLLLVFMANGIASAFPATLFVFYVADVLQTPAKTGMLLATYFVTAALAVPIWVRIAARIGRPRTWLISMVLAMVAFVGAAFLGVNDWLWFLVVCVVSGAAVGTDLTLPASMVADLGEKQGATGLYFGFWNLVAKMNLALGAGIALPLLSLLGYTPGSVEHNEILIAAYVLLPLLLKGIALVLLYRWRYTLNIVT